MLCITVAEHADPRRWGEEGIPVRLGSHVNWPRVAARDAQGYAIVVWSDMRTGIPNVYAQLISPQGVPLWDDEGIAVAAYPAIQAKPAVVAVEDGWIVAWADCRVDVTYEGYYGGDVWAQKLTYAGQRMWPDNDYTGVCVDAFPGSVSDLFVVHDNQGGAIFAWADDRTNNTDIRAQRVDAFGVVAWPSVLNVTDVPYWQAGISADGDGSGNMLLAWQDQRTVNDRYIYAAKITSDGQVPWGSNGICVSCLPGYMSSVSLCSDGNGGCYVAWHFENIIADIMVQRLNGNGQPYWTVNGIVLCNASYDQRDVEIELSETNGTPDGCIAVWEDMRVNGGIIEIYAQKVSPDGQMLWTTNGVKTIGDAGPNGTGAPRVKPRCSSDRAGGMICTWTDTRAALNWYQSDVYAQQVSSTGTLNWQEDGMPVNADDGEQYFPVIMPDNNDGVFVFWSDIRAGLGGIRLQRLDIPTGNPTLTPEGVEIVAGIVDDAYDVCSIPMTPGRVAMIWRDYRNNGSVLYYQIIDTAGNMERVLHGEPLITDNSGYPWFQQSAARLCSDGANGFFVVFRDLRTGIWLIRAAHVDVSGNVVSDPAGVVVAAADMDQLDPYLCPDGAGGRYIVWEGWTTDWTIDLWIMRMTPDLQPAWGAPVRLMDTQDDDVLSGLVLSSEGCCIAVWRSGNLTEFDISSARICPDGTVSWNQVVCDAENNQESPVIIADGQGGAYFAWADTRDPAQNKDIYAQHLTSTGAESWTHNGLLVVSMAMSQNMPTLSLDSQRNLYVVWEDYRSTQQLDLYMQKITPEGALRWLETGKPLCLAAQDQYYVKLASDQTDGLFAVWLDQRDLTSMHAYGTHIDSTGEPVGDPYWVAESGGQVSEGRLLWPGTGNIAADGTGGYVIPINELRKFEPANDVFYNEIYAQRIFDGFGVADASVKPNTRPTHYALNQNYPNPFNPTTEISFDLPRDGSVSLKVFDILGREVATLVHRKLAAGKHHAAFDATSLPSGIYIYRLQAGEFSQSRKMVVIK
jgi:hypothetical protein